MKRMDNIQRKEGGRSSEIKGCRECHVGFSKSSWLHPGKRLNVETKFLGESFFIKGKCFPLRKNAEIRQNRNRNPYCLHRIVQN
jgi:hypothetical protein